MRRNPHLTKPTLFSLRKVGFTGFDVFAILKSRYHHFGSKSSFRSCCSASMSSPLVMGGGFRLVFHTVTKVGTRFSHHTDTLECKCTRAVVRFE
jgi:hypothetical protein